jgi:acetyl-CoA C-acetyltransferase
MREVYVVAAKRTPIGSFNGALKSVSATQLGAHAIKGTIESIQLDPQLVDQVIMGHVLGAQTGQAPATQAAHFAGLPAVPATSVNKVCASGLKAITLGAQAIQTYESEVLIAGGMESMSQVPYYLPAARSGLRLGHGQILDGIHTDGLTDVYGQYPMGFAAEKCAEKYELTRDMQDAYAILSYNRALQSQEAKHWDAEIIKIQGADSKGKSYALATDEALSQVRLDKIPQLPSIFKKDGTITVANASSINDGAAACILMSAEALKKSGHEPIARIVAFADAQHEPDWFTTAPATAIQKAVQKAGWHLDQIDLFEINEAFSAVALANMHLLQLSSEKVNVLGGAVAIGHPLGMSGTRMLVTLLNALQIHQQKRGCAAICNGGGGATALLIERL